MVGGKALPGKRGFSLFDTADPVVAEDLQRPGAVNIVFGAGFMGRRAVRGCFDQGIAVTAFCDNDPGKTEVDHIAVLAPAEAVAAHPGANFILAVADFFEAARQLAELGCGWAYGVGFLDAAAGRLESTSGEASCDRHLLGSSLSAQRAFFDHPLKIGVGFGLNVMITERCTLRCRDCANLMQYYRHPVNRDADAVMADVDALLRCVDYVHDLQIIGGEPLVHPGFADIAVHAASRPGVRNVGIYTNGTLVPTDGQLDALADAGIYFSLSDYGSYSRNKDRLVEALERRKMRWHFFRQDRWFRWRLSGKRNLGADALRKMLAACRNARCLTLLDGRLYRCEHAANAERLGVAPDDAGNYLDLRPIMDGSGDPELAGQRLWSFMYELATLPACDYCFGGGRDSETVEPAIQAAEPLPLPV